MEKNRMENLARLFRIFNERGLSKSEMDLFTEVLNDEYDFGWRGAEAFHSIPTQREYGTGHAKP